MRSKFDSRCHGCEGRIAIGDEIVGYPPTEKRRRWEVFHVGCLRPHTVKNPEAWRKNREWMTDRQWDDLCAAMARQVPPGPPPRHPRSRGRSTAETLDLDSELEELMLDPTA
jgi:hypothetical protein